MRIGHAKSLKAVSPLPGQFRLVKDGKTIQVSAEDQYQFNYTAPVNMGVYRIEQHVKIGDSYFPWVYTNPIYVF